MPKRLCHGLLLLVLNALFSISANAAEPAPSTALIRMAAADIDRALGDIQASTSAIAEEYARLYQSVATPLPSDAAHWREAMVRRGHTVQFKTWKDGSGQPAYQGPHPAYYAYGDAPPDQEVFRELAVFKQLTPVVRAAYNTFDFSWTYVTSANSMMLLYPFLTLEEAVNNYPPIQQVFYTQADFTQRKPGWTEPYLDLAGAGMMITVSAPAFDGDTVIGVASHDITLDALSSKILAGLTAHPGEVAYIVDNNGLLIGVSDTALGKEMEATNSKAGAAVMHYRSHAPAGTFNSTHAPWINTLTEQLITSSRSAPTGSTLQIRTAGYRAWAAHISRPGWFIVLASPNPQSVE